MLVGDTPVAVDLAQADGEPEQKAVLVFRVAGRTGSAPQDRDGEGHVGTRRDAELAKFEGRAWLVAAEKQVPGLPVGLDTAALQGLRQVEHHDVIGVVREYRGEVPAADRVGPVL